MGKNQKQTSGNQNKKSLIQFSIAGRDIVQVAGDYISNKVNTRVLALILVISLFITGWGLYTYFYPKGQPELYITLRERDESDWSFEMEEKILQYPEETLVLEALQSDYFYKNTFIPDLTAFKGSREEFELFSRASRIGNFTIGQVATFFYILNRGGNLAENVWFKIYFDPDMRMAIMGTDEWNTAFDENLDKSIAYYKMSKSSKAPAQSVTSANGMLALDFLPIPRTYELPYVIASDNANITERTLKVRVETDYIDPAYVNNAVGIEYIQKQGYDKAIKYFEKAVEQNGQVGVFYFNLGTSIILKNTISHENFDSLINLSEFRQQKNILTKAESALKKASFLSPDISEVWGNLTTCLIALEKWDEALISVKKALKINPDSEIDQYNLMSIQETLKARTND